MKAEAKSLPTHAAPDLGAWLAKQRIRLAGRLQLGLHSEVTRYGLRRDLTQPLEHPKAKIPISVRELQEGDLDTLLNIDDAQGNPEESLEITRRRAFVEKGIKRCFVAVDGMSAPNGTTDPDFTNNGICSIGAATFNHCPPANFSLVQ